MRRSGLERGARERVGLAELQAWRLIVARRSERARRLGRREAISLGGGDDLLRLALPEHAALAQHVAAEAVVHELDDLLREGEWWFGRLDLSGLDAASPLAVSVRVLSAELCVACFSDQTHSKYFCTLEAVASTRTVLHVLRIFTRLPS